MKLVWLGCENLSEYGQPHNVALECAGKETGRQVQLVVAMLCVRQCARLPPTPASRRR